ncbi:radical SAM/SPASM domain-containing protein [Chloroflexota bacterium]
MLKKIHQRLNRASQRPYQMLQIETSMHCNLECVMCPWIDNHSQDKILTPDTFSHIRPYLSLAKEVDLTGGGEPLANPHITEIVRAAKDAGCQVGFSTNGTLLTRDLAANFVKMGLDWISFSFDAATPETYHKIRQGSNYDTVIGNIQALRELKTQMDSAVPRLMMVFVMMTGNQENFHELPEYIDLAHSLSIEQVVAKNLDVITKDGDFERVLFTHNGDPLPEVEAIREKAQKRAAELGIGLRLYELQPRQQVICEQRPVHNLYINWAGNVSPCITLSYAENRVFNGENVHVPCQIYGDINKESLETIWAKPEYAAFRNIYEIRQLREQEALMQTMLGGSDEFSLPPAPEGCQTCYYLYGI